MTKPKSFSKHIGKWVRVSFGANAKSKTGILAFVGFRGLIGPDNRGEYLGVFLPSEGRTKQYHRSRVNVLDKAPRAWTCGGLPPAGRWFYSHEDQDGISVVGTRPTEESTHRWWTGDEEKYQR